MVQADIVQQAGRAGANASAIAGRVIEHPESITELIDALQVEKGTAKYGYEKVLRLASEQRPDLIYPYFDFFAGLIDCDNNFLKWGAIMTIANLTAVDGEGRFEVIFERYYAPIPGPMMITAATIIGSSPKIARAKPGLTGRITQEILKVQKAKYESHGEPSPECRNVAIGHAIDAFEQFFDRIEDKVSVIEFVRKQLKNTRKQVARRAEHFLRTH
jgi:hypothetical protein